MAAELPGEPRWVPVADAARALGVTENAVRRRIRAGTIPSRREVVGNRARTLVRLESASPTEPEPNTVALLTEQVRHLEGEVAWLRARLEAELARRRWPGIKAWLQRLWAGDTERP